MVYRGKYERAKYLVWIKARIPHQCDKCGKQIEAGEFYYKEKIDMRPPPGLVFKEFCDRCGNEMPAADK